MPAAMATAESDSRLIERVGRGDREAFELLYKRFARPVLGMALRQLGDNGRAEDAAQETFAAVWRSARSYRAERGTAGPSADPPPPGSMPSPATPSSTALARSARWRWRSRTKPTVEPAR